MERRTKKPGTVFCLPGSGFSIYYLSEVDQITTCVKVPALPTDSPRDAAPTHAAADLRSRAPSKPTGARGGLES